MTSVRQRRAVIVLAWVLATVLAGGVAWWAVSVVGRGPSASEASVLSQAEVAAELAAERAAAATATPPADPTPTPTPTPTTDPTQPTGEEIARTWDVAGGQVSASCRGTEISLLGATPLDGWSMEIKDDGPQEVEVEFGRGEAETSLNARCVDGTPQMTLEDD